jgi:hypothetical protein
MTFPWQLHQDYIRTEQAALARTARHAAQLAEVRHRRKPGRALTALRSMLSRRIRSRRAVANTGIVGSVAPCRRIPEPTTPSAVPVFKS